MTKTSGISGAPKKGPGETINPQTPHSEKVSTAPANTSKKKKILTAAFNMAVGCGVSMAVKSCVVGAVCAAGVPLLAASVGAAALAGIATGSVKMLIDNRDDFSQIWRPENRKANAKKLAFHAGFSMLGALACGLAGDSIHGFLSKAFNFFSGHEAATVVPVIPATLEPAAGTPLAIETMPVSVTPPSTLDRVGDIIAHDDDISERAKTALERAKHGNAQALKDLGFFLFNGKDGFAMDRPLAVDLFKEANALGHGGAGVDLAYSEYHGLGKIPQHQGGGIAKMLESLDTMEAKGQSGTAENNRGWNLLNAWLGSSSEPTALPSAISQAPAIVPPTALVETLPLPEAPVIAPLALPEPVATAPLPAAIVIPEVPAIEIPAAPPSPPVSIATETIDAGEVIAPVTPVAPVPVPESIAAPEAHPQSPVPTGGKMGCTPIFSDETVKWHCSAGKDVAILNGDKVKMLLIPGHR